MTEDQAERFVLATERQAKAIEQLTEHLAVIAHTNAVILSAMTAPDEETPVDPMMTMDGRPSAKLAQEYQLASAD